MTNAIAPPKVSTHEVLNQPPALVNYNLFSSDRVLRDGLAREGGQSSTVVEEFGKLLGSAEVIQWGFQANENQPKLHTHDRFGHRVDEVEFHPAWHNVLQLSVKYGLHCESWFNPVPGAHVARAALMMLAAQNEEGHLCPVTMTHASIPVLRLQPEVAREWEPRVLSHEYDPRAQDARSKQGVLIGMAMTEKQGGSDVRANTTRAEPMGGGEYAITGHKWFCSAPMCDAFLVLAQAPRGLSCFMLPRWTPDGERNAFYIQRLKQKLGNWSNASSEVEFDSAWARLVGPEGRGVATIIEMVQHSRLDCTIASAALMRQALVQALHHTSYRAAFGKRLIDQPLMRNVLADLAIESEAATTLMLRLARAFDRRQDPAEHGFARLGAAAAKFWTCKRAVVAVSEALECLGGNGYVEESILPRLYRETPLNSLWEGSGNVICLDVLRAMLKEPDSVASVRAEIRLGFGAEPRLDDYIRKLEDKLIECENAVKSSNSLELLEPQARRLTEHLALALQGSLLVRHSVPAVVDGFISSRLEGNGGHTFGTLDATLDFGSIITRAWT